MAPTWSDHASNDQQAADARRRPAPVAPAVEPAITTPADPRLGHRSSAAAVVAMQRSAGNAAVASLMAGPPVQRAVTIDEMTTTLDTPGPEDGLSPEISAALPAIINAVRAEVGPGAAPAAADPANPAGSGVTSDGGTTTIHGSQVNIEAAMTRTSGVVQADTVIAQNVVGSNYTPGAGNVW
jgi:hypothetical protein